MTQTYRVGRPPRAPRQRLGWIVAAGVFALVVAAGLLAWWHAGAVAGIMLSLFATMIGLSPTRRRAQSQPSSSE